MSTRKEYHDLTSEEMDAFGFLTEGLSEATGEEFEWDDQYVFTESIGAWGEEAAHETIEHLEDELDAKVEWDMKMECGKIAILFAKAAE